MVGLSVPDSEPAGNKNRSTDLVNADHQLGQLYELMEAIRNKDGEEK